MIKRFLALALLVSTLASADSPPVLDLFKLHAEGQTGFIYSTAGSLSAVASAFTLNATPPLSWNLGTSTLSIPQASSGVDGFLAHSDWAIFNAKQSALTFGSFTASSPFSVSGGSGAVIGSGVSLGVSSGYYFPTTSDQSNWNSKQASGNYLTGVTGDLSVSGPGVGTGTLATVNSSPGTYTNATVVVDSKGRVTSASNGSAGGVTSVTASSPLASSGGTTPNLSVQSGYYVPTTADESNWNSKMSNLGASVYQTVYVAVGGNDSTGDGSIGNPYLTVSKALSTITTAGSNNRWIIKLMGGKIVDTTTPLLKPWVYIAGDQEDGTYWKVTAAGNNIGLDPSFATVGGARFGIANVYLGGGTNLDLDFYSVGPNSGTPSAVADLEDVTVTGNFTFNGRTPDIDYLQGKGIFIFGTFNSDAAQTSCNGCVFEGATNLTSNQAGANSQFSAGIFQGAVTVSGSNSNLEQITASPMFSTLSVSGASTILTADFDSLPTKANQTVTGGAIALLGDSHNLPYTPTTPSNWTVVPSTVQAGLDTLASSKQNTLTLGNLTASAPFSLTGGTGAIIGSGAALGVSSGYYFPTTTDQSNWNAKQSALTFTFPLLNTSNTVSINSFGGDSGSGGTPGAVPSPGVGQGEQGYVLGANGSWDANDTQAYRQTSWKMLSQTAGQSGTTKNQSVAIMNNGNSYYAVVAGGQNYLQVFNITDQAEPVYRGSILLYGQYNICPGPWPYVYVPASGSPGRVDVVSIANPASPVDVSHIVVTGSPGSMYGCAYSNGVLAIATQSTGLVVLDAGGLGLGGTSTSLVQGYQQAGGAKSFGVSFSGSNLYTTQYSTGSFATRLLNAWTIPTSGTPTPTLVASKSLTPVGESLGVSISGNTAYVTITSSANLVDIVDITTPTAMNELATYTQTGTMGAENIVVPSSNPNFIYVASSNAGNGGIIDLVDVTTRSAPTKVASTYTNVANSVFGNPALDPRGGYLWAADYGVAPGSSGTLDLFTTAYETFTAGIITASSETVNNLTVNGTLTASVSPSYGIATLTSTGSIPLGQVFTVANCSSTCTLTLPAASSVYTGTKTVAYEIQRTGSALATVAGNGGDTINGSSTAALPFVGSSLTVFATSTGWNVQ